MNFLKRLWHKEDVKPVDNAAMLNEIAKALDCVYAKEIDPASFTHMHCFYRDVYGRRFKVASMSADTYDDYLSLYGSLDILISTLKFDRDRNVKMIEDGLEYVNQELIVR